MPQTPDTIAALATPAGTAALATVRVSGPLSGKVAEAALGRAPRPRAAFHAVYRDASGTAVDDVVAVFYAGPSSYTGEDCLEMSCHGSPYIVRRLLSDLFARGLRPAAPGEFTERAFLNGRMDLSQAEAVMDLISARSERALAAARAVLAGALGRHVGSLIDSIVGCLASVEAYIDFPEEDLPAEDRRLLEERVLSVLGGADRLLATERTGVLLREGISTVLVGEPNAGKSSLFNRIAGSERAIVSDEPGTTRDLIEVLVPAGPHALRLVDTAGLNPSASGIEAEGVSRAVAMARRADILVVVLDATRPYPALAAAVAERIRKEDTLFVVNKSDLAAAGAAPAALAPPGFESVAVCARTGAGVDGLVAALARQADRLQETFGEERIAINVRHAHQLEQARVCLQAALAKVREEGPPELLASDLRGALSALGEISGKVDNERVLDQLFATFCIGK